jgi:type IV secretory pathway TrbD component
MDGVEDGFRMSVRTKAPTSGRAVVKRVPAPSHRANDIAGILLLASGAIVLVAISGFSSGVIGTLAKLMLANLFGKGAWLIPVLLSVAGVGSLRQQSIGARHLVLGFALF